MNSSRILRCLIDTPFTVNVAISFLIDAPILSFAQAKRYFSLSIAILSSVAVIFRAEVAFLLAPLCFQLWARSDLRARRIVFSVIYPALVSLGVLPLFRASECISDTALSSDARS